MSSSTTCPRHWKWRAAAALVAVSQLVVPVASVAQVPSASSVIQSRASASYIDFDGVTQVATSNVVQTTVQQVGSFTVSAGSTKSAASGAPVTVMHSITNSGNGSDTFQIEVTNPALNPFASIDVFADADANGLADSTTSLLPAPITVAGAVGTTGNISVAGGGTYSYVVVYTLPTTAGVGWSGAASVKVTAGTPALYLPALPTATVTDTINRTTAAAFSAALTHSAPLVAAAGGGSWGATPSSGVQGTATTYTFNYTNNGSTAGQIYLKDVLPAALTYQTGTAVWSSNPGLALTEAGAFGGASPTDQIAFKVTGQTVEALIKNVQPGESGTLSFKVVVGVAATFGTHTSVGSFSQEACTAADLTIAAGGTGCGTGTTNVSATFTVLPVRGVKLGPVQDVTPGTPTALDVVTMPNVVAGGSVKFTIPVTNNGNQSDTFKLSLDPTAVPAFPAGTTFIWFYADGLTPLQNSVGGSAVDTGPVAALTTVNVVLQANVPSNATVANGANLTIKALANSFIDPTKVDAVNVTVTNVVAGLVDVTSTLAGTAADIGPGAVLNTVTQSLSVNAGSPGYSSSALLNAQAGSAAYDLYVHNYDSAPLTFSLESSLTTTFPGNPPAGWTVRYYLFNTDVATSVAGAQITTIAVANGAVGRVLAVVTPLSSSSAVTALDVYFRARSTTVTATSGTIANDFVRTQITVTTPGTRSFILSPAGSIRQIAPGSVVDFPHTVLNNSSQACGTALVPMTVTATMSPAQTGPDPWKVVLYLDNGTTVGQIDSGDTLLTSGNLGAALAGNSEARLLVRVYSPSSGAPGGSGVSVTLKVEDLAPTTLCGVQSLTNAVSVTVGQLEVTKFQVHDPSCNTVTEPTLGTLISAKPTECIVYRSVVRNNGTAPVSNVSLHDVVPPFTTYSVGQPAVQCESTGLTPAANTVTNNTAVDGTLYCSSAANSLIPGGTITLRYRVLIN